MDYSSFILITQLQINCVYHEILKMGHRFYHHLSCHPTPPGMDRKYGCIDLFAIYDSVWGVYYRPIGRGIGT